VTGLSKIVKAVHLPPKTPISGLYWIRGTNLTVFRLSDGWMLGFFGDEAAADTIDWLKDNHLLRTSFPSRAAAVRAFAAAASVSPPPSEPQLPSLRAQAIGGYRCVEHPGVRVKQDGDRWVVTGVSDNPVPADTLLSARAFIARLVNGPRPQQGS